MPKKAKKPWINKNLLQMVKRKKHLWTKYRRSRNQQDLTDHRNFAKRLTTMIRNSRKNFENKLANEKNLKKLFKYIRLSIKSRVSIPMLKKNCVKTKNKLLKSWRKLLNRHLLKNLSMMFYQPHNALES